MNEEPVCSVKSNKPPCPKCGHGEVTWRYCNGDDARIRDCCGREDEHLHRTCERCLYGWIEECKDKREKL